MKSIVAKTAKINDRCLIGDACYCASSLPIVHLQPKKQIALLGSMLRIEVTQHNTFQILVGQLNGNERTGEEARTKENERMIAVSLRCKELHCTGFNWIELNRIELVRV